MHDRMVRENLGSRPLRSLQQARFPDAESAVRAHGIVRPAHQVDVLLVNLPTPDSDIWIRSQHRVGRRSRGNMVWPQVDLAQVDLAQMAALLAPDYGVEIVDAAALRMGWDEFEKVLREKRPRYYITQVTAPTLTNDMYGVFLARGLGAITLAFGTHVTPMPHETMEQFPALDFVLRGEPELTLRELLDTLQAASGQWSRVNGHLRRADGHPTDMCGVMRKMMSEADSTWTPAWMLGGREIHSSDEHIAAAPGQLSAIKGLVWRRGEEIVVNADRPFIRDLDDLPLPLHHLLPLDKYRTPMVKGPYTFVVTSRGCPAGCKYCIKHVNYQHSIRIRTPENIMRELLDLNKLGIRNINMYADLFTVNRDQVVGLCNLIIKEGLKIKWTCNSCVDYVDEELLRLMGKAGCWYIAWGIESANEQILKHVHKGYRLEQAPQALAWAHKAGIKNWGCFIIGLPGETVETIQQTIALSKSLPLDIVLFHIAAPYPGTPFFFEVLENNWFRPGTQWESVDMDQSTVLDYPDLKAEEMEYWQKRAFREWALRPGPMWTYLKSINGLSVVKSAVETGWQTLSWVRG
jgi:anaerobic magnesium-protoporphyrin IX monomethyl ester cyclase